MHDYLMAEGWKAFANAKGDGMVLAEFDSPFTNGENHSVIV